MRNGSITNTASAASPIPTPTILEPNGPVAPVLVSGSTPRILARPDLDDALGDAGFVGSRGFGRRTAQHPAIGEIERAAVQRALHRPKRSAAPHNPPVQWSS